MRGELGRLLGAIGIFEVGNVAATLLILRATDLLEPGRSTDSAAQIAIALYPALQRRGEPDQCSRRPSRRPAHAEARARRRRRRLRPRIHRFAFTDASIPILAACFIAAGVAIGAVETAEHSAIAALAAHDLRGSSFGALAGIQSFGNFVASSTAGLLYASVSPTAAFLFPAAAMLLASSALVLDRVRR
jgi:hypothetical protein